MILDTIKKRRSVYPEQYNDTPVTRNEITQILEAANWAPTHKKTEPWRFKVFRESAKENLGTFLADKYQETVENFSEFKQNKIKLKASKSSCVIAICMQRDPNVSLPEWEEIAAVAMAVQNMWLVAHDLGVGAYWSSPALIQYLGEHVHLNEGEKCIGFFYMGKYDGKLFEGVRKSGIHTKTVWI